MMHCRRPQHARKLLTMCEVRTVKLSSIVGMPFTFRCHDSIMALKSRRSAAVAGGLPCCCRHSLMAFSSSTAACNK